MGKDIHYMHIDTGSVDTEENWASDWEDRDIDDESSLDEWMSYLVEVKKVKGQWVEV